jgi:hypothetical protein
MGAFSTQSSADIFGGDYFVSRKVVDFLCRMHLPRPCL